MARQTTLYVTSFDACLAFEAARVSRACGRAQTEVVCLWHWMEECSCFVIVSEWNPPPISLNAKDAAASFGGFVVVSMGESQGQVRVGDRAVSPWVKQTNLSYEVTVPLSVLRFGRRSRSFPRSNCLVVVVLVAFTRHGQGLQTVGHSVDSHFHDARDEGVEQVAAALSDRGKDEGVPLRL